MLRRKKYTAIDKMLSKLLQKQGVSKKEAFKLIEQNVYADNTPVPEEGEETAPENADIPAENAIVAPEPDMVVEVRQLQLRRVLLARKFLENK